MSRQVIRIYLAAPPELTEERRLIRNIVEQINELRAAEQNVSVRLIGGEDEATTLLREEVRIARSDLFVLLLWKNWEQSEQSSLEWKFQIAESAFAHSTRPRPLVYFRSVSPEMMADPGEQLRKVISFRSRIEDQYRFTLYDSPLQWKNLFSEHLNRWLDNRAEHPSRLTNLLLSQLLATSITDALQPRLEERESAYSISQQSALTLAREAAGVVTQGKITQAEMLFSKALEVYEDPAVLHSFGLFLQQLGSLDRAENLFKRLLTKSLAEEAIEPIYQSLAFTNLEMIYTARAATKPGLLIGSGLSASLLQSYLTAGTRDLSWINLRDSLVNFSRFIPSPTLAHGLAMAFRSKDTAPFGEIVSHLYRHSLWKPRTDLLQTLIATVGGATGIHRLIRRRREFSMFSGLFSRDRVDVFEIRPETVQALATYAEQKNPETIDKVSRLYSAYPEVIKHLAAKPLAITLSSMAEREAANPRRKFFVNFLADQWHGSEEFERTAQQSRGLFANSWFEDKDKNVLLPQTPLVAKYSYNYLFSIDKVKRLLSLRSDPFAEPSELSSEGTHHVQLEVICPLLDMKSGRGIMRRTVKYYSGSGIRRKAFPLKPLTAGEYSLTIRVFYIRRLLYRAMLPLTVLNSERSFVRSAGKLLPSASGQSVG